MKYAAYIAMIFICLFAGLSARQHNIANRVPHADEAEQATTFLKLRETGEYKYNPNGPHGPTLYYWANSMHMPDDGNITVEFLRKTLSPIAVLILLAFLVSGYFAGRGAAWAACAAFAMSAIAQIYTGYFVHEAIFAFAVFATAVAVWKFACAPSVWAAAAAGVFAALAQSTKETSIISFAAIILSLAACAAFEREIFKNLKTAFLTRAFFKYAGAFIALFAAVFAAFYSSFGDNWAGLSDAFIAYGHFFDKAENAAHSGGALYYLKLLAIQKSEGARFGELPILILALCGLAGAAVFRKRLPRRSAYALYVFANAFFAVLILSCITYKTPWLLLSPMVFLAAAAGMGAYFIFVRTRSPSSWAAAVLLVCGLGFWQYKLSANASVRYDSDPRNPFIYSHTVRDFKNLVARIDDCAKFSEYKTDIPVAFIMKESPWPAPFSLRGYRNAGFWSGGAIPENIKIFDVVVCDHATEKSASQRLDKSEYETEFYGLRKNLILTVYIKKKIFDKITADKK